jgi:hypothetical protein
MSYSKKKFNYDEETLKELRKGSKKSKSWNPTIYYDSDETTDWDEEKSEIIGRNQGGEFYIK